jgi:hypothetical protein
MRIVLPVLLLGILALPAAALVANDSRARQSHAASDGRKHDLDRDGRVNEAERARAKRLDASRKASKSRPQAKKTTGAKAATGKYGSAERQRLLQQRAGSKAKTTKLAPPSTRAAASGRAPGSQRPAAQRGRT